MPNTVVAAKRNAAVSLLHGAGHFFSPDVIISDADGFISGSQFTIPTGKTGKYGIHYANQYSAGVHADASTQRDCALRYNSLTDIHRSQVELLGSLKASALCFYTEYLLAAGEFIEFRSHFLDETGAAHSLNITGEMEMLRLKSRDTALAAEFLGAKYSTGGGTLAASTWESIADTFSSFGTEDWDEGHTSDIITNGQATIPRTGYYRIYGNFFQDTEDVAGGLTAACRILINGTTPYALCSLVSSNNSNTGGNKVATPVNSYTQIYLEAGQTVDWQNRHEQSVAQSVSSTPTAGYGLSFIGVAGYSTTVACFGKAVATGASATLIDNWNLEPHDSPYLTLVDSTTLVAGLSGVLDLFVNLQSEANATGERRFQLFKNGVMVREVRERATQQNEWGRCFTYLDSVALVGDEYQVKCIQDSGGTRSFSGRFGGSYILDEADPAPDPDPSAADPCADPTFVKPGFYKARFLFDNLLWHPDVDYEVSSENTSYPASNLLDPRRSRTWRTTGVSNQYLEIGPVNGILTDLYITNHNLTESAVVHLLADPFGTFASPLTDILVASPVLDINPLYYTARKFKTFFHRSATDVMQNFIRITFHDPTNTDGYLEFGVIWPGFGKDLEINFIQPWTRTFADLSPSVGVAGGRTSFSRRPLAEDWTAPFTLITYCDRLMLQRHMDRYGTGKSFFVHFMQDYSARDDRSTAQLYQSALYGKLVTLPAFRENSPRYYECDPIRFREDVR